jgi:DNA (cytosine-5)-methyltransferase 1
VVNTYRNLQDYENTENMKYISLFAGIGGFDLALNRLGHEAVYVNEWDKYAAQIYEKNFNHKPDTRDIRTVAADDIPDHDLLVGGFPCQAFSLAGKRRGFSETRGTLFFEICRIAAAKRTPYLLLENVEGLLSHDNGQTFTVIIRALDELGYDIQWQVVNSKDFGVPQNRTRVYIAGHLRDRSRPEIFPITGTNPKALEEYTSGQRQGQRVYGPGGVSVALSALGGGMGAKTGLYMIRDTQNETMKDEIGTLQARSKDYDGCGFQVVITSRHPRSGDPSKGGTGALSSDKYSFTIDSMPHYVNGIRKLTPTECERLQGFPDGWTEGISDTQRYKCLGNAVTVNVIQAIMERFQCLF